MTRDQEPIRLDLMIEVCMVELGMSRAEAEAEVRRVAAALEMPLTEVGHA